MTRRDHLLLLATIWALVILVFFSFSSRQEYYTIPALPGLALVIGAWLADETADDKLRRAGRRISAVLLGIAIPAFLAGMVLLWYSQSVPPGTDSGVGADQASGRIRPLVRPHPRPDASGHGHFPASAGGFCLFLCCWAQPPTGCCRRRGRPLAGNIALALMALVLLQAAHRGLEIFSPILSSKYLSDELARVYRPGEIIVVNGAYEDASTLNFYGHFQLHVLNTRTEGNLYYGSLVSRFARGLRRRQFFRQALAGRAARFSLDGRGQTARGGKKRALFHYRQKRRQIHSEQPGRKLRKLTLAIPAHLVLF